MKPDALLIPDHPNLDHVPKPTYSVEDRDKDRGALYHGEKRPVYKLSHEYADDYEQSIGIRSLPGFGCDMVFMYSGMLPGLSTHDKRIFGLMVLLVQLQEHVEGHFDVINCILGVNDSAVNYAAQKLGIDTIALPWLRSV